MHPDSPRLWDIEDIVQFMDLHNIGVQVKDGKVSLIRTKGKDSAVKALMPHLRVRRPEIVGYYLGFKPFEMVREQRPTPRSPAEVESERRAVRNGVWLSFLHRAARDGKGIWGLETGGLCVHLKLKLPDEVCYLCLAGDEQWAKIPRLEESKEK